MHFKEYIKLIISVFLLVVFLSSFVTVQEPAYANPSVDNTYKSLRAKISSIKKTLELKRQITRQKIYELKQKENVEVKKLYQSQNQLEATKNDIAGYQERLDKSQNNLRSLHSRILSLTIEQQKTARLAGERLKQVYKGERISILHLIFAANSINTFLDRIYYQKRLAVYDKQVLNELRAKTRSLMSTRYSIENEKYNILSTMNAMNEKKKLISSSINTSQYLINKLRSNRSTYESAERELARQSASLESRLRSNLARSNYKGHVTAGFMKPVMGVLTSPFGWRKHPIFGSRSFHTGVDLAAAYRTPVKASNSGTVVYSGWYGGYGKVVIVNHGQYKGKGTSTLYAHLSATAVSVGGNVKKGQVIGYEGTTGYSTGPHLHFEVRLNGKPTNPLNYI